MQYPAPVQITNRSAIANAYRNLNRSSVDKLFAKAETLETSTRYDKKLSNANKVVAVEKIAFIKSEAKQLWRKIITISNTLN